MSGAYIPLPDQDNVAVFIDSNTELFERYVLNTLLFDTEFRLKYHGTLCCSPCGRRFSEDFEQPMHNAIYYALSSIFADPTIQEGYLPPVYVIQRKLEEIAGQWPIIALDDIPLACAAYGEIIEIDIRTADYYAKRGMITWLKKRKFFLAANHALGAGEGWDVDELVRRIGDDVSAVSNASEDLAESFETIEYILTYEEPEIDRKSTGIPAMDVTLGGGLGRSEHLLAIAPTGSGKTVLACQLGVNLAQQGDFGILLTTEQMPNELLARMVSANCNIPFNTLSNIGLQRALPIMEEHKRREALQFAQDLQDNLIFRHLKTTPRGEDINTYIRKLLDAAERKYEKPVDFFILDWIGGALSAGIRQNPDLIRVLYQTAADSMADIARDRNIRAVSFAQTNPSQSHNKPRVDLTMMAECKTMGNNATAVVGISALLENDSTEKSFREDQFLYFSKSRKGESQPLKIRRDFAYQRFTCR